MLRPTFRRALRLELLETREVLSAVGPSAEAQYMLDMINLARTNPQAAAQKFTSNLDPDVLATLNYYNVNLDQERQAIASSPVRPPLAWNDQLAAAATGMATDQAVNGFQSHVGSDGSDLGKRLDRTLYTDRLVSGENSYASSKSADHALEAFLIDWGVESKGHRNNLLQPTAQPDQFYREVGIGIVKSQNSNVGPLVVTQDFGARIGSKAQLLGVVYHDQNGSGSFDMNEGQGGVEIDATSFNTGKTVVTQSWDSGGYQVALDSGKYMIQAKLGGKVIDARQITIQNQNMQVDYNLTALGKNPQGAAQESSSTSSDSLPGQNSWASWVV